MVELRLYIKILIILLNLLNWKGAIYACILFPYNNYGT